MLLSGIDKEGPSEQPTLLQEGNGGEDPLSVPPPSLEGDGSAAFDDADDSFSAGGDGDVPPDFTPYDAEH
jgi:hypothetical protein